MEVSYEREEVEEVLGMDLDTTKARTKTRKVISPTSSDSSSLTSESSSETTFEYFATMGTNSNINGKSENSTEVVFTNGEKHTVLEGTSVIEGEKIETLGDVDNFEEPNVAQFSGTNGFSVHQNGSSVAHNVQDSDAGIIEIDAGSNGSSLSKSPNTDFGFKDVESLLSGQNENVVNNTSRVLRPEEDEFHVERIIQKQETHDLFCPNCRSCITERVILQRRKRKTPEKSTGEEFSVPEPFIKVPPGSEGITEESFPSPPVSGASGVRFDAISCFSCFSIFVPTSEGFLCWRFKPKPNIAQQPGGTPIKLGQPEDSQPDDKEKGNFFPTWIVTCCQPAEKHRPGNTAHIVGSEYQPESAPTVGSEVQPASVPAVGSEYQPASEDEASSEQSKPSLPPSYEPSLVSELPAGVPLKGELGAGRPSQTKPLNPIKPSEGSSPSEIPASTTVNEGNNFPMWFLTCCQPSMDGNKADHLTKTDRQPDSSELPSDTATSGNSPSRPSVSSKLPSDATAPPWESPSGTPGNSELPSAPSDDNLVPPPTSPTPPMYDPGTSTTYKPKVPAKPIDEIPLSPHTEAPDSAVVPKPPQSQTPVMPPDSQGTQTTGDVETGLLNEPQRPGVSGFDIIKAIVYGGLLESITSLSIITSAAGGDATTLNIVALGLANVFGGLVVLVHNLRVLKHEHTTERYQSQLGRPGHYMLHAIVAILSYLVFGLISPVIYGFSFRKSDNKDYKLATLAGAALLSITVLSAAKSYVRDAPKAYIKTIFYYISLGFMVSGLGYVAGDLINSLLKKLGIFDQHAPVNPSLLQGGGVIGAWSSYR